LVIVTCFAVLGIECRALSLLNKGSDTQPYPKPLMMIALKENVDTDVCLKEKRKKTPPAASNHFYVFDAMSLVLFLKDLFIIHYLLCV